MSGTGKIDRRAVLVFQSVFAQLAVMSDKHVSGLCGGQSSPLRDLASDCILNGADAMHLSANRSAVMVPA